MIRLPLLAASAALLFSTPAFAAAPAPKQVVEDYATLVHLTYADALREARALQAAVDAFLKAPTDANLTRARQAWFAARVPYSLSEAFRFYDGPIEVADAAKETPGPEARLNSWPLNEAYIDAVKGNSKAGLVNDPKRPLSEASLSAANQAEDEANVATGYHAVEFLLWGQDFSLTGPGSRPASDYSGKTYASKRRRAYLKLTTAMIVEDLAFLEAQWAPGKDNYARTFTSADPKASLGKILTGLSTLSVHELGAERLNNSLSSGDQEDEEDCFSDHTTTDLLDNVRGIENVLNAHYGSFQGTSPLALLDSTNKALTDKLRAQLAATHAAMAAIPAPFDAKVLATPEGSPGRVATKKTVDALLEQGTQLLEMGKALGVPVEIVSD